MEIPGYVFDPVRNRYFKATAEHAAAAAQSPPPSLTPEECPKPIVSLLIKRCRSDRPHHGRRINRIIAQSLSSLTRRPTVTEMHGEMFSHVHILDSNSKAIVVLKPTRRNDINAGGVIERLTCTSMGYARINTRWSPPYIHDPSATISSLLFRDVEEEAGRRVSIAITTRGEGSRPSSLTYIPDCSLRHHTLAILGPVILKGVYAQATEVSEQRMLLFYWSSSKHHQWGVDADQLLVASGKVVHTIDAKKNAIKVTGSLPLAAR